MKTAPTKANALRTQGESANQNSKRSNHTGNSVEAQRSRVLDRLRRFGSATTIELRRDCDILMPGTRIHELRHRFGYPIDTVWCTQATECGKLHRVARYVYRGKDGGAEEISRIEDERNDE